MDFLGTASTALPGESMAPLGRLFSDYVLSEAAPLAPPPATTIDRCEPVLIESARLWELPAAATVPFLPIESEQPKLLALASLLISSVCRPGWAARRQGGAGLGWDDAGLYDGAAVAQRCGGQQGGAGLWRGGAGLGRGERWRRGGARGRRRRGGAHGSGSGVRPSAVAFWRVRVAGCFF